MNNRVRIVVLLFLVAVVGVGATIVSRGPLPDEPVPSPQAPLLPDLVSLPLEDFLVGTEEDSRDEALRFSSSIVNLGDGPLVIEAQRVNEQSDRWRVVQWFEEPGGERTGRVTGANMVFGGHGHDHWHVAFGASYRLSGADGEELASQTKAGFCFFDQVPVDVDLAGAPKTAVFKPSGCGERGYIDVEMGMSVGWSDPYFWQLEDQFVAITGLADGRYRLTAVADPDGWFEETDESNNETWVLIELGTLADGLRSVEVVETAPAP